MPCLCRVCSQARGMIAEIKAVDEAIRERQHEMLRRLESMKAAHAAVAHASKPPMIILARSVLA